MNSRFSSAAMAVASGTPSGSRIERDTLRQVTWRLMPLLLITYIVAWLDRVNVGFAALQMNHDLGFSATVYGFGAGVFFVGYALCEIPSNLALCRYGARRWIARIMVTWGLLSAAMVCVHSPLSFYGLRFLIGVAEAGFFPGIIFYLSRWYPAAERAKAIGWFMTAIPLASIIGGPLAGLLLGLNGWLGLAGWQWLFLTEGLPAVLLAFIVLRHLPDDPSAARWLAPAGAAWLSRQLQHERSQCDDHHRGGLREALMHPIVWQLGMIQFLGAAGSYGLTLWLPQILKGLSGLSDLRIGLVTTLPYIAATVAMVLVASHSDRTGERCMHVAVSYFVAAFGFCASAALQSPVWAMLALTVAAMGTYGRSGPFWALPSLFLSGRAAAGGIALINTIGSLGGFAGPYAVGLAKATTGSFAGGLALLALASFVSGVLAMRLRRADVLQPVLDEPPRMPALAS